MVEMAFKVNPGTTFYKNYFSTKEEKAHFVEIAKQSLKKPSLKCRSTTACFAKSRLTITTM